MENKIILITGANSGIGKATATALAEMGAHVVMMSRDIDKGLEARQEVVAISKNNQVDLMQCDLASFASIRRFAAEFHEKYSRLDVLINNAGYLIKKPIKELTQADFQKSLRVNFLGPVELIQFLSSRMEVNGAHVVNISTMGAFQGSAKFPELAAYASSKTALCNFTEVYAEENKDRNIRMNCLCLGAVQTEMLAEAFPGYIAKISAEEMADFISDFAINKGLFFNGKIIPVSNSTP